jgi:transcriptional regulator NrdR family protein
MTQYSLSEIIMDVKQMAAERIVARQVGEHVLNHIEEYMRQKHAATIRLRTLCALILEAFQLYDTSSNL